MRVRGRIAKKSCLFTRASSSGNTSFVMQVKVFQESELWHVSFMICSHWSTKISWEAYGPGFISIFHEFGVIHLIWNLISIAIKKINQVCSGFWGRVMKFNVKSGLILESLKELGLWWAWVLWKMTGLQNLVSRNERLYQGTNSVPAGGVALPFILVQVWH